MVGVAQAVHHAHQQDVIHRDLKPANILVDEMGQPKILDFGVARMIGTERPPAAVATQTLVGVLLGTLPYMSPEQTEADPDLFDQRSDVYALGVITYKLRLFNCLWALIGIMAWFWWLPFLPRGIRYTEFMINTSGWTIVEASLAWVNWRVMHKHVPSMWIALVSHVLLAVFTAAVLFDLISYDGGGGLQDRLLRVALYTLFTPLAFLGILASLLCLITAYRLRQWDRPVLRSAGIPDTASEA
jgi:Protein kinase domain